MNNKISMIDEAYAIIKDSNEPITFEKLLKKIQQKLELTDEEISSRKSKFYTNLSLDSRFVNLGRTGWDLSVKYTFAVVHEEVKDLESDNETEITDLVDEEQMDEDEEEAEESSDSDKNNAELEDDVFIPSPEGE